ncbi:predicted protein [Nematostella vectensis]|uniref:NACHT domain-containing protein n=1 Tax=Nematostella vectensis TaxID=45351 RepID=A7RTN7_NEMVE|nr:predicted protein [Nematostella vectensis]|eukprot:XP_001637121.1 predicted protein [Nematostella vectensis]
MQSGLHESIGKKKISVLLKKVQPFSVYVLEDQRRFTQNQRKISLQIKAEVLEMSSAEKHAENFSRLCRLLVDGGSSGLRKKFDSIHPPSKLTTVLNVNKGVLHNLWRGRRVINNTQWYKLYPNPGSPTPTSHDFDVTLLFILLRNICGLTPPKTGWDALPAAGDTSPEAHLVRIKYYRNNLYAHATHASIDDAQFEKYWKEISAALVALGVSASDIHDLKTLPGETAYIRLLKEWRESDVDILQDMNKGFQVVGQHVQSVDENVGVVGQHVQSVGEKVQDAEQKVTKGFQEVGKEFQVVGQNVQSIHEKAQDIGQNVAKGFQEVDQHFQNLQKELQEIKSDAERDKTAAEKAIKKWVDFLIEKYSTGGTTDITPLPWMDSDPMFTLKNLFKEPTISENGSNVKINDLFKSKTKQHVLLEGNPGVGKTTLCKKLVNCWALSVQKHEQTDYFVIHQIIKFLQFVKSKGLSVDDNEIEGGHYRDLILKIGKYAFDALLEDKLTFTAKDLPRDLLEIGFVEKNKASKKIRCQEVSYSFLHKSLQDYLAALHFACCLSQGDEDVFWYVDSVVLWTFLQYDIVSMIGPDRSCVAVKCLGKVLMEFGRKDLKNQDRCNVLGRVPSSTVYFIVIGWICEFLDECNRQDQDILSEVALYLPKYVIFNPYYTKKRAVSGLCHWLSYQPGAVHHGTCSLPVSDVSVAEANNTGIVELSLSRSKSEITQTILTILKQNTSLRCLRINSFSIHPDDLLALTDLIVHNNAIEILRWDFPLNIHVVNALKHNKSLRSLNLSLLNCADDCVMAIADMIYRNTLLKELTINDMEPKHVDVIANALRDNVSIKTVTLLGRVQFRNSLVKMLSRNNVLEKVVFGSMKDYEAALLLKAIKHETNLKRVSLDIVITSDENSIALAEQIKQSKVIDELRIESNGNSTCGPIGKSAIASALALNKSIKSLELYEHSSNSTSPFPAEVEIVLLLKCRDIVDAEDWKDILRQGIPENYADEDKERIIEYMCINEKRVALVIDGYDELNTSEKALHKILCKKALPQSFILMTSRRNRMQAEVKNCFDASLEIKGIESSSGEQLILDYFRSSVGGVPKQPLPLILERYTRELLRNPLHAAMLCVIIEDNKELLTSPPSLNIPTLYKEFIFCLTKRFVKREGLSVDDKEIEGGHYYDLILKIGKYAFDALLEDKLTFTAKDLPRDLLEIGFVEKNKASKKIRCQEVSYSFLHKSLQDYLAALHFAWCLSQGDEDVFWYVDIDVLSTFRHYDIVSMIGPDRSCVAVKCLGKVLESGWKDLKNQDRCNVLDRVPSSTVYSIVIEWICEFLDECNRQDQDILSEVALYLPKYVIFELYYNNKRAVSGLCHWLSYQPGAVHHGTCSLPVSDVSVAEAKNTGIVELSLFPFSFDLRSQSEIIQTILTILKQNTSLRFLRLQSLDILPDALLALADLIVHNNAIEILQLDLPLNIDVVNALKHNKSLRSLNLSLWGWTVDCVMAIADMISRSTLLKKLTINGMEPQHVDVIANALRDNVSIKTLKLPRRSQFININSLVKMLSRNNVLEKVVFGSMFDYQAAHLLKTIKQETNLKRVSLDIFITSDESSFELAEQIQQSKVIDELKIDYYKALGPIDDRAIASALARNKSIKSLELYGDVFSSGVADRLSQNTVIEKLKILTKQENKAVISTSLLQNPSLKSLTIFSTGIDVLDAEVIAEILSKNGVLRKLHIHCNIISDEVAKALADGLKTNTSLKVLNLSNEIGDKGASAFADMLSYNSVIEVLDLRSNPFHRHGYKKIRLAAHKRRCRAAPHAT